jgi:hypothetical protein
MLLNNAAVIFITSQHNDIMGSRGSLPVTSLQVQWTADSHRLAIAVHMQDPAVALLPPLTRCTALLASHRSLMCYPHPLLLCCSQTLLCNMQQLKHYDSDRQMVLCTLPGVTLT